MSPLQCDASSVVVSEPNVQIKANSGSTKKRIV